MKNLLVAVVAILFGLGLLMDDAEARRLGGARSSGMNRDSSIMKRDTTPAKPAATPNAAPGAAQAATPPKPSGLSRWAGPLAGLAAGLGLAALFSHLGMGEGMANLMMMLLLAGVAFMVIRWVMSRNQPPQSAMQYAGAGGPGLSPQSYPEVKSASGNSGTSGTSGLSAAGTPLMASAASVPADFDSEGFLRQAKLNFIRLQAANDSGNMEDVRQFVAPELFAEIQMQFQERGRSNQHTDVVQLDAALLDLSQEASQYIASVRFSGRISEAAGAPAEPFSEVWHLVKPADGTRGWTVAGIQQDA